MSEKINKLYNNKSTEYYSSVRYEIIELLPTFAKNVLDIGCGDGNTLRWLKSKKKCENIYGIEISKESSDKAKEFLDGIENINIEENYNFFPGKKKCSFLTTCSDLGKKGGRNVQKSSKRESINTTAF